MSHEQQPTEQPDRQPEQGEQVRDAHAPAGWTPEAAASIAAAAHLGDSAGLDPVEFMRSQQGKPYTPNPEMFQVAAELLANARALADARRGNDATSVVTPGLSGAGERWEHLERRHGASERRGVVSSFVVEDCARRVAAWAATLPTPQEQQTALAAADVIRQGR